MTLAGLKTTMKEIAELKGMLPKQPTAQDDAQAAFMARFTSREIIRISEILTRADRDINPTVEEVAFLTAMVDRPTMPLPPITPGEPVCDHCGRQPASERDLGFMCDACWREMGGYA
ncbi:MAG: hypothetical protein WCJ37_13465, partial [Syntrophus sp. (in: bacteria)]